jgi:retrograde regulation protein 2
LSNEHSIKAHLKQAEDKKERIVLSIRVSSANIAGVSLEDLADSVERTAKKNGGKKPRYKITAQVSPLPCHISSST